MKRCGFALCLVSFLSFAIADNAFATQWAFRVSFINKNGTLDINAPLAFLSQRALDRRSAQGIAVDSSDLPVSAAYVDSVLSLTNGVLHTTSRWANNCVVLLSDSSKILMLQNKPFISSIKYIAYYPGNLHNKAGVQQAKFAIEQPAAKGTGQPGFYNHTWNQTDMVNGDCLHDQGYKGQGKLIAVIDQGFSEVNTHPGFDSLNQSGRLLETFNFVLKTTNVYGYSLHGTSALSTIAGYVPNTFVGSAPLAKYVLYISEDTQTEQPIEMDNMAAAAERADSIGANIITSSLGYNIFTEFHSADLTYADINGISTVAAQAANNATKKGILFVITAGNEGGNAWNNILTPGDADSALTVGAVSPSKVIASFSGFGPNSAGVVKPDICMQGDPAEVFSGSGTYITLSGTSFATPQVAGWAACMLQANPNAKPYQLRKAIVSNADHYGNPGVQLGYGIPDFCAANITLGQIVNNVEQVPGSLDWIAVFPTVLHTADGLNITSNSPVDENVTFSLNTLDGRNITSLQTGIAAGQRSNFFAIPASLPAGVYIFRASTVKGSYTERITKF